MYDNVKMSFDFRYISRRHLIQLKENSSFITYTDGIRGTAPGLIRIRLETIDLYFQYMGCVYYLE